MIPEKPTQDLISQALLDRPELSESQIDLQNREITRKAAANACCPRWRWWASTAAPDWPAT